MTIFFYYVLSFLISTACANWYYGLKDTNYWCEGTGRINKYHIGSFTFAALLLTIIKIMKMLLKS